MYFRGRFVPLPVPKSSLNTTVKISHDNFFYFKYLSVQKTLKSVV